MRIRIDNAMVYDGTGAAPWPGRVVVEGDRIIELSDRDSPPAPADLIIDATGLALCPGFIDTHSHSDLAIFEEPMVWPKIRQGITTEIFGQDGVSMAPLPETYIAQWRKNIAGLEGTSDRLDWNYRTTQGYLNLLEHSGVGPNVCYLVPHGNVRMEAMGLDEGTAAPSQLEAMCTILQRELDAGGRGLSTGLIYPPCTYADTEELIALCRVAARNDVPLVIHQRSEADNILESMEEVLHIGRASGVHVHFSHFKLCGKYNAPLFDRMLRLLDTAAKQGMDVTFDQYPYVAGSTMLSAILPPWAHAGGTEALLARLADPAQRERMLADIRTTPCDWDNFIAFAGVEGISITNVQTAKNRSAIGKTLVELGRMRDSDPINAALDLILEEENGVSMVDFYGQEEHVRAFMLRPEMNVCTDGLMHGTPHPRTFAAFPRVLGTYVRGERLMPLEEAIRKMTLQPARVFGIRDRGKIAPCWYADLVLFDPATVIDTATFTEPRQHPPGIELVMINGAVCHGTERLGRGGMLTNRPPGRVLR